MSAKLIKSTENKVFPLFSVFGSGESHSSHSATGVAQTMLPPPSRDIHYTNSEHGSHNFSDEAHLEAERILAEAAARATQIEHEARERGMAEARNRMASEIAKAAEPLRERLTQTLDELASLRSTLTSRTERDLVRLALEIAKKIVHREVTIDHEIALTLTRVALSRLHNRAAATIRLHPDDYSYVCAHREQINSMGAIEIVEDRSIGRGGCLIQTEMGDIDGRIEQQFMEIERGLMNP
jgi:flagellar assembly protein FliH